jgi:hypothetical protein
MRVGPDNWQQGNLSMIVFVRVAWTDIKSRPLAKVQPVRRA